MVPVPPTRAAAVTGPEVPLTSRKPCRSSTGFAVVSAPAAIETCGDQTEVVDAGGLGLGPVGLGD